MNIPNSEVVQGYYIPPVEPVPYDIIQCGDIEFLEAFDNEIMQNGLQNSVGQTFKLEVYDFNLETIKQHLLDLQASGYIQDILNFITIDSSHHTENLALSEYAHFFDRLNLFGLNPQATLKQLINPQAINILLIDNLSLGTDSMGEHETLQLINTLTEPHTGYQLPSDTIIFARRTYDSITDSSKEALFIPEGIHYRIEHTLREGEHFDSRGILHTANCNCKECIAFRAV